MPDSIAFTNYVIAVFFIVFIASCVLNLLKQHYIFQLTGITFFLLFFTVKLLIAFRKGDLPEGFVITLAMPALSGISACFTAMVLGFWIFPAIRNKFRN